MNKAYKDYLTTLHAKFVTPDEVIHQVIKEATGLGVKNKRRIIAGEASEVYDIELDNGLYVILRISRGQFDQYEQERWVFQQCQRIGGIPVPEILLIKHIPLQEDILSLCVQKKLPGETLERGNIDFGKFTTERKRKIINRVGEILSRIHTIVPDGFGYLQGNGKGTFPTFSKLMSEHVRDEDKYLKIAQAVEIPNKDMEKIFRVLREKAEGAPDLEPVVCHNDYNPKHIMIDDSDNITGIIDWGEMEGNSPLDDFANWDYWFNDSLPIEWLQEGYSNKSIFHDAYEETIHWFRLNNGLGVIDWYYRQGYFPGVEKAKRELQKDLGYFS